MKRGEVFGYKTFDAGTFGVDKGAGLTKLQADGVLLVTHGDGNIRFVLPGLPAHGLGFASQFNMSDGSVRRESIQVSFGPWSGPTLGVPGLKWVPVLLSLARSGAVTSIDFLPETPANWGL